jgi:hypothetical protein
VTNKRITGANSSQPLDKGWGRILLFGSAQPTQKYEAKGGFTGGIAPNGGTLGFPTDDRILPSATKENGTGENLVIDTLEGDDSPI